jgi:hypothetical protein
MIRLIQFLGTDEHGHVALRDCSCPCPVVLSIDANPVTWVGPSVFRLTPAMARSWYGEHYASFREPTLVDTSR